jgi:hypothetical protein
MTQQNLFELEQAAVRAVAAACPEIETNAAPSRSGDGDDALHLLVSLARQSARAADPVERARLAIQVERAAEMIIDASLREANGAGVTWREIGARVGVPFQTLHRRYGGG